MGNILDDHCVSQPGNISDVAINWLDLNGDNQDGEANCEIMSNK